jgi:hypothetical protein
LREQLKKGAENKKSVPEELDSSSTNSELDEEDTTGTDTCNHVTGTSSHVTNRTNELTVQTLLDDRETERS